MGLSENYRIGAELGRGALGRVVVVTTGSGERFAGKILHPSNQVDERASARFAGEAEIASSLRHPNVAAVHGLVEIGDESVLLMELVEGPSLAAVIARSAPIDEERLLRLAAQLADGLAAAHHLGLIHRDLKPDNVLVGNMLVGSGGSDNTDSPEKDGQDEKEGTEQIKLVDFGMARATSFAGVDADAFAVVGTPDYMAPESIDPLAVDSRSDLYALGCILFEMATAEPPFLGATAFSVIEAHREQPVDRSTLDALLSPQLAALIVSLLAKSPSDRPQSAEQVAEELRALKSKALVVHGGSSVSVGGACAACGVPSVPGVSVCFGCGLQQIALTRGKHTVFVTGPGETTDKLDATLRQKLVDWLVANPALGIAVGPLAKKVPRLPFVLAKRVSKVSAQALVGSLKALGLESEAPEGGALSLPAMRKKGLSLGGRFAIIGVSSLAYAAHNVLGAILLPIIGVGGLASLAGGFWSATRPAAEQGGAAALEMPESLRGALSRVAELVPTIEHDRHRDSLRGVVQRAMAARTTRSSDKLDGLDDSLANLINLAVIAVSRIDAIDTAFAKIDIRNPTSDERGLMLERDSLAARLLEITAFLDTMRVRLVALEAESSTHADALDELRVHIEALEEIESL